MKAGLLSSLLQLCKPLSKTSATSHDEIDILDQIPTADLATLRKFDALIDRAGLSAD
jgi:hypothetical protein